MFQRFNCHPQGGAPKSISNPGSTDGSHSFAALEKTLVHPPLRMMVETSKHVGVM
jgi:hypothetical protein